MDIECWISYSNSLRIIYIYIFFLLFLECTLPIDLGLLVDGSGSIVRRGKQNFGRLINFIRSLVSFFKISSRHTRVGMVIYGSRPYKIFRLNRYRSRRSLWRAIGRVRYPGGGTKTGKALRYTLRNLFRGRTPKSRKRVLVLLTDGVSQDSVKGPALRLKKAGVEVFTIAVGKSYRKQQLRQIASDGSHIIKVSFSSLPTLMVGLKTRICMIRPSKYKLSYRAIFV